MLKLVRTDSHIISSYNNTICIKISPRKMEKMVKQLDEDLKKNYLKYSNK